MMRAAIAEFDFSAHGRQEPARGFDIANLWNVLQNDWLIGEQGGGNRATPRS